MQYLSLFVLAFAVSLDGFGVGITYGLRKIRFPWWSLFIVTVLSGTMILLAMGVGGLIVRFMSPEGAKIIGASILICIGGWALYNVLMNLNPQRDSTTKQLRVFRLELKKLGLVIQILKTPTMADMDHSGSISGSEAFFLGIALSMDAFGAGLGASMVGYKPLETAFAVSLMSLLFIGFGLKAGYKYSGRPFMQRMVFVPGIMLILIGLSKIFS